MSKSLLYTSGSVFTNRHGGVDFTKGWVDNVSVGWTDEKPSQTVFNVAVIEFNDDGSCVDEAQLGAATQCISEARKSELNSNGALVLVFIHGWHHNAEWNIKTDGGDSNFHGFREVLKSLTLREAERQLSTGGYIGRRVIGIYIGWSGDPPDSLLKRIPLLTHLSFYNRTQTAGQIGSAPAIETAIEEIVLATKRPLDGALMTRPESPLVMIGHSMGALVLESAFDSLLKAEDQPLVFDTKDGPHSVVSVREGRERVHFPDLFLALNSAADSVIAKEIIAELKEKQFAKTIDARGISYSPPVLISMTSMADDDTKIVWRIANLLDPTHKTDGHDASLFTHEFNLDTPNVASQPRGFLDYGQDWHSLRMPVPAQAAMPAFFIDLPKWKRKDLADQPEHERYKLAPLLGFDTPHLAWVFQVPRIISEGHNDIFNFRARLLVMALIQVSGAVMSLAEDFEQNFE